jgi:hypothetical protein
MVRQPWETRTGRRSRGGRCGPSLGRPPGGSFDHQPQHFLALEFEVFREDRERGDVEGAPVILSQSGVAPTGWNAILRKQFGYLPTSGSAFGNPK